MPSDLLQAQLLAEAFACTVSEWADPYELEAEAEAFFAQLVAELPAPSTPYGRGFTAPVVMS